MTLPSLLTAVQYDSVVVEVKGLMGTMDLKMMDKVKLAIMQAHFTLFAVGGGYLPGERGVLRLLQEQGYTEAEAVR